MTKNLADKLKCNQLKKSTFSIQGDVLLLVREDLIYFFDLKTGHRVDKTIEVNILASNTDSNGLIWGITLEESNYRFDSFSITGFTRTDKRNNTIKFQTSKEEKSSTTIAQNILSLLTCKCDQTRINTQKIEFVESNNLFKAQMELFKGKYIPSPTKIFYDGLIKVATQLDILNQKDIRKDSNEYNICKLIDTSTKTLEHLDIQLSEFNLSESDQNLLEKACKLFNGNRKYSKSMSVEEVDQMDFADLNHSELLNAVMKVIAHIYRQTQELETCKTEKDGVKLVTIIEENQESMKYFWNSFEKVIHLA